MEGRKEREREEGEGGRKVGRKEGRKEGGREGGKAEVFACEVLVETGLAEYFFSLGQESG